VTSSPRGPARRRAVQGGLGGVLALAVVAGYLVTSGALDPLIGDAVQHVAGSRRPSGPPAPRTAKVADWQYFDDRPEWSAQRGVPQVPGLQEGGPGGPVPPTQPAIAPPENPKHWRFDAPPPVPRHSLAPMRSCPQPHGPSDYVENFQVTSIKGGATVSWWDLHDPDLVEYEVKAVPEFIVVGNSTRPVQQLPIKTLTVAAPGTCKVVQATITGLTTGTTYRVVLQASNRSRVNNLNYRVNRGTTDRVVIG
jgi:hypothetical protein